MTKQNVTSDMDSTTKEFWIRCEGETVDSYRLGTYLGGADSYAVYSTEDDSRPAAIKLLQVDGPDRERNLARWAEIIQLSHPGLVRLFGSGQCEIEGVPLLYVVMEATDGDLAGVLPERALTVTEAREMVGPALAALGYLHERGFVHGCVKPSNIMAVGDEVKLASDCIARAGQIGTRHTTDVYAAPESRDGVVSPAGDVWSLGATIIEAFSQRPPDPAAGNGSDCVIPRSLPQPFFDIAYHCMQRNPQSRFTVAQIASRLEPPPVDEIPITPQRKSTRLKVALIAMGCAILAAIGILLLRDPGRPGIAATVPASAPQPVEVAPAVLDEQPRQSPVTPQIPVKKAGNWVVVVATYSQRKDAEKRALSMTKRFPQFKAEAYTPPLDDKAYHFVVLGSGLSQNEAADLRDRARARGMRDAYITRFSK